MKKMKKLSLVLTLVMAISIVFTGCSSKEKENKVVDTITESNDEILNQDVIRVATYGLYYPYTYMEDDNLTGFDVDVWEEIGKRTNKKIEWEITSFEGMFSMLDKIGRAHV